ncbi:MAG: flagellar assembly protein FliW [Bdellovibrio sp. CG12_big_fil_rev_8_21_14_0_65_39_13]|nr:MAG: flagellar assembly protein FliW [Bdellovibrio sp. CG22_combo_CG10-13_8_21_14_all_39_27]PIQ60666.1 MAG: flagellar assembly protein FliW [Bdellovibrio sp. CG12_big_fil_rev_8_21_14_0_65_39_13]PIR37050.1 MAG: flagellar assembly protein FliW [Bdellovibrio sp. CG11_big_fil_rev_8_21_14_0_20_39_38]PJB52425.1 MAG: flagellar assembly protein FliW [Bdellovibrio sp. CG_4_9_14_3_um_filter_39_7]
MKFNTTRFGELEVDKKDILNFAEGLLGFEQLTKFFVVDPGDQTLILWLQSVDDPKVAFPILEPKIFKSDYSIKLLPSELQSLSLESLSDATIYAILTIPKNVTDMSANLKAPIIINNKTKNARQIVLQDSKLEVRFNMYIELKRSIVAFASDDSKRTKVSAPQVVSNTTSEISTEKVEAPATKPANNTKEL